MLHKYKNFFDNKIGPPHEWQPKEKKWLAFFN